MSTGLHGSGVRSSSLHSPDVFSSPSLSDGDPSDDYQVSDYRRNLSWFFVDVFKDREDETKLLDYIFG